MDLFQTAVCRRSRLLVTLYLHSGSRAVNECLCLVPFLLPAKTLASGMVPPTVGRVSHLSECNQDNPSTNFLHKLACPDTFLWSDSRSHQVDS